MLHRAFGAIALLGMFALRHNHLMKSTPGAGDSLGAAPRAIELWFHERPEIAFTSVTLLGADSLRLPVGKAAPGADSLEVIVPLQATLPRGDYLVRWRTASQDGHAVRGEFRFSVR
jgi:methionine-rich copper-binding protein CopC